MNIRTSVAIVICAVAASQIGSSQARQRAVSNQVVAAGVPQEYKSLYEIGIPSGQEVQVWAGFPYDSIEFERTPCFGLCPAYRVKLLRGGKAELQRISNAEPLGQFEGAVNIFDYGKLCYLMKRFGFDDLSTSYAGSWTDAPTFILSAAQGTARKVVSDYSGVGPIELWAMQQAVDAVVQRVTWTKR